MGKTVHARNGTGDEGGGLRRHLALGAESLKRRRGADRAEVEDASVNMNTDVHAVTPLHTLPATDAHGRTRG